VKDGRGMNATTQQGCMASAMTAMHPNDSAGAQI
jgi:hypothetical protein